MPSWIEALKTWNKGHSSWCIPRKDTPEYAEVRKIMNTGKQVEKTPDKKNPVKKTPVIVYNFVENTPVKKTPVKKTPV